MTSLLSSYVLQYPTGLTNPRMYSKTEMNSKSHPSRSTAQHKALSALTGRAAFGVEAEKEDKEDYEKQKPTLNSRARPRVVAVDPKNSKGPISEAVDHVEKLLVKLMYDSSRPQHYLSGNFAPVQIETPPTADLPVRGHIPECLNGQFMRVGPNSKFAPIAGYHWFDGDGMIHGMRIRNGKATYASRYVETSRLQQEEFFRSAKFLKMGDLKGLFGLLMIILQILRLRSFDISYGLGTSNTALTYHHGQLLALHEFDKPYVVKILENGDLQTIGMLDYEKRLGHSFTAHPKIDPFTGEMFTFGCSFKAPHVTYRVILRDGFMHEPVPITIPEHIMMHDFAITQSYAIFMDLPMYLRPAMIMKGKSVPYIFDGMKNARFGVLPRYAENELQIRWFELPSCFIFHNANAWEEGNEVVLITCRVQNPDLERLDGAMTGNAKKYISELYEMRFNMKTGLASQKKLSETAIKFPRINESYTGRKQRYVYGAIVDSLAKVTGIAKFDLHAEPEPGKDKIKVGGNVQGVFHLGAGRFGSEAIFVPREPGISSSEEDDGYLIFFAHDENSRKSQAIVIDARTMSAEPVAVVELPNRVPYGFHALFVTEEHIRGQAV
ncbi:carotenoid 9,10(9',10')-cleavage dioxygenase-like [Punica granatum]|uniref:carotenoid 9,10-dioxygenase n=1 Tax=Punica granatum TaxID=22663 RepID=A0A6P8DH53_PUNGR|nr:carotenoid 9,10(9',10')-cleavage dioxygenase-like [Punica granatum]XP_031395855.1 carotenoid 9,10(9',10')-cleavage dioxygenase-like [Punica granatum]